MTKATMYALASEKRHLGLVGLPALLQSAKG